VVFAGDLQQNCWRIFLRFCARSEIPRYAAACAFPCDENTESTFSSLYLAGDFRWCAFKTDDNCCRIKSSDRCVTDYRGWK
jgi:hypothetical protein